MSFERYKIGVGLFGETGVNPVRARRRKACIYAADLTGSHIPGIVIGRMSEKAGRKNAKSKYPDRTKSLYLINHADITCAALCSNDEAVTGFVWSRPRVPVLGREIKAEEIIHAKRM